MLGAPDLTPQVDDFVAVFERAAEVVVQSERARADYSQEKQLTNHCESEKKNIPRLRRDVIVH